MEYVIPANLRLFHNTHSVPFIKNAFLQLRPIGIGDQELEKRLYQKELT
jgi:hypothetical protein